MKHIHHIIPKHMGGTDDPSNRAIVTVRQHALAHKKLYEQHGKLEDYLAWKGLSGQMKKEEILERLYKMNGKRNAKYLTKEVRQKAIEMARRTNTGRKLTPEHIAKTRVWGMKQSEYQKQRVREVRQLEYIITDPKGKIFEITNLLDFARKHKLDQGNLTKVAKGMFEQHKGYKVSYK
jgi:hypothetical protein